ncbi:hypothetical protein ACEQ8H_000404 [Pleosporales sp. CAS-2024a]
MSHRPKDTTLANSFTTQSHTKPTTNLEPQNNKLPSGLHVLIIGASQGIGAGIVEAYARAGAAHLLLAARKSSSDKVRSVQGKVHELAPGTQTKCLDVDITSAQSVFELAQAVQQAVQRLDIVVLNSGYSGPVVLKAGEGDARDFQQVFNVNLMGTYHVAHFFVPLGHIANTAYCISKFAQARLVEFLSEQYGQDGVFAVAVHPGAVKTEMADQRTPESFRPYLTDDVGLCGAFRVWLSQEKRMWLNGRLLSARWDVDELVEKKASIEEQDLLKFGYRVDRGSDAGTR